MLIEWGQMAIKFVVFMTLFLLSCGVIALIGNVLFRLYVRVDMFLEKHFRYHRDSAAGKCKHAWNTKVWQNHWDN